MSTLTDKQDMFCREYLVDLNATQAAIRCGYSAKTANRTGTKLLSNTVIQARIAHLKSLRAESINIDAKYVLKRLHDIDEMDVIEIMNDDFSIKPLSEWPKVWRQTLSAIDINEITQADDISIVVKKIKWPDKVRNLELIGKHVDVKAWDKEAQEEVTVRHVMPVPTAASAEDWEEQSQKVHKETMSEC